MSGTTINFDADLFLPGGPVSRTICAHLVWRPEMADTFASDLRKLCDRIADDLSSPDGLLADLAAVAR